MKFTPLTSEEIQLFKQRMVLIGAVAVLGLVVLVFRLWFLQIIQGGYYQEVSKGNRIRVIPQGAPRGLIYDRNGLLLAFNRPSFNIELIQEDTPDLNYSLSNLSRITGISLAQLKERMEKRRSSLKFKPIELVRDVGRRIAALLDTYQEDLPGIRVAVEPKRLYPNAALTSHLLGYVGVVSTDQYSRLPLERKRSGRIVGRSGVEKLRNDALIGFDGGRQVEVDHVGRELRTLGKQITPRPGKDIYLSIDLRLQRYVAGLMKGKQGAVIVSQPRTGEILSISSFPDFDPNLFVGGIGGKKWLELTRGKARPLMNKAVQGQFPPGSIFKLVLAAGALEMGVITPDTTFVCKGKFRLGNESRYCWKRSGHGELNLAQAIAQSCNVFFYQTGLLMGVNNIAKYARMFGFGSRTGVEVESEQTGLIPTRQWKLRTLGEKWYDGETLPVSIGQGFVTVTPIQMAAYVNTIANGGVWVPPTLFKKEGPASPATQWELPKDAKTLDINPAFFEVIRKGMTDAVHSRQGTAQRARSRRFTVAGKTGTSQLVSRKTNAPREDSKELDKSLLPHSLFIGFAPAEAPELSVVVLVEHGESGGRVAAPIGRKILEFYSKNIQRLDPPMRKPSILDAETARFRRDLRQAFGEFDSLKPAPKGKRR